jgi:hypothetical protein
VIEFNAIREAVRELLVRELPSRTRVAVEVTDIGAGPDPEVGIFIPNIKWEEIELGAVDPYDTTIAINLLLSVSHPDGAPQAVERRDEFMNLVIAALKTDRKLGGKVLNTTLSAGEMESAQDTVGYIAAANITINARIMA